MASVVALVLAGLVVALVALGIGCRHQFRSPSAPRDWFLPTACTLLALRQGLALYLLYTKQVAPSVAQELIILFLAVAIWGASWRAATAKTSPPPRDGPSPLPGTGSQPLPVDLLAPGPRIHMPSQDGTRDLFDIHEQRQQMLAHEIHDGFVQHAAGALMCIQAWRQQREQGDGDTVELIEQAERALHDAVGEARRLIRGLRPAMLDEGGPVPAIESFLQEVDPGEDGPHLALVNHSRFHRLTPPLETAIFRIVQEAVTNALRHSGADSIVVRLQQNDGELEIEVVDNGCGFDPTRIPAGHYGVRGLGERAQSFGGSAEILSQPGEGTTIRVRLPLGEPLAAGNGN